MDPMLIIGMFLVGGAGGYVLARVEHYEIAAYGAVSEFAKVLGETEHASLLEETLGEENETDDKLKTLAREINAQANEESPRAEQDESKPRKTRAA